MTELATAAAIALAVWVACAAIVPPLMQRAGFNRSTWRILATALGPLAALMAIMCYSDHHRPELTVEHQGRHPRQDRDRRHVVVLVTPDDIHRVADSLADVSTDDVTSVAVLVPHDTPDPELASYRTAVHSQLADTPVDPTVVFAAGRLPAAADAVVDWDRPDSVTWIGTAWTRELAALHGVS
jgi:hypothetical protein